MPMPSIKKFSVTKSQAAGLVRFWKDIRSLSVSEIAQEAERPFQLSLVGTEDQARLLAARLALETPTPKDGKQGPADVWPYIAVHADPRDVPAGGLQLDADALTADETRLAQTLAQIVVARPDLRLSLARHVPAFRPAVAAQIIAEFSWTNAKLATLSAIPGIIPFTDLLLPVTAVGDIVLLTKNQGMMLLQIAAAYGLPVDLRARTRELAPVVGSAFGWRAIARQLVGLVPGGVGVVLKGSIAYAGTYTVGKAAQIYYSTGQTLSPDRLKQLGRDAARDARARLSEWRKRGRRGAGKADTPAIASRPQFMPETVDKPLPVGV